LVARDGDVFGDSVNLAARLAGLASKGQIMTSRETVELMSPIMRSSSRRLYSIEVKGKATPVDLYEILWQQTEDQTTLATNRSMVKQKLTTLRLKYLEQEIILEGGKTSLTLGRDKAGDVIIIDRMASRQHGKIERRLDKFVLADHSANGTYVTVEGENEVVLRRAEFSLRGHGWISFGQPRASATETVEFYCE
jgi:adenylate cyclase